MYALSYDKLTNSIREHSVKIAFIISGIAVIGIIVLYFVLVTILNPLGVYAKEIYNMS